MFNLPFLLCYNIKEVYI